MYKFSFILFVFCTFGQVVRLIYVSNRAFLRIAEFFYTCPSSSTLGRVFIYLVVLPLLLVELHDTNQVILPQTKLLCVWLSNPTSKWTLRPTYRALGLACRALGPTC